MFHQHLLMKATRKSNLLLLVTLQVKRLRRTQEFQARMKKRCFPKKKKKIISWSNLATFMGMVSEALLLSLPPSLLPSATRPTPQPRQSHSELFCPQHRRTCPGWPGPEKATAPSSGAAPPPFAAPGSPPPAPPSPAKGHRPSPPPRQPHRRPQPGPGPHPPPGPEALSATTPGCLPRPCRRATVASRPRSGAGPTGPLSSLTPGPAPGLTPGRRGAARPPRRTERQRPHPRGDPRPPHPEGTPSPAAPHPHPRGRRGEGRGAGRGGGVAGRRSPGRSGGSNTGCWGGPAGRRGGPASPAPPAPHWAAPIPDRSRLPPCCSGRPARTEHPPLAPAPPRRKRRPPPRCLTSGHAHPPPPYWASRRADQRPRTRGLADDLWPLAPPFHPAPPKRPSIGAKVSSLLCPCLAIGCSSRLLHLLPRPPAGDWPKPPSARRHRRPRALWLAWARLHHGAYTRPPSPIGQHCRPSPRAGARGSQSLTGFSRSAALWRRAGAAVARRVARSRLPRPPGWVGPSGCGAAALGGAARPARGPAAAARRSSSSGAERPRSRSG